MPLPVDNQPDQLRRRRLHRRKRSKAFRHRLRRARVAFPAPAVDVIAEQELIDTMQDLRLSVSTFSSSATSSLDSVSSIPLPPGYTEPTKVVHHWSDQIYG